MSTTDSAICLRATDYSETSQVLTLLTRDGGVVRLMAKGTKRPRSKSGGRVDLLAEGRCVYASGRGALATLMEFAESTAHTPVRRDLGRLNVALYMLELCGALLGDDDPHPAIFDLLHNGLARLEQADAAPGAVLAYFQWRIARHAGLLGALDACVACGRPVGSRGAYFTSVDGGLLCADCEASATEKIAAPPAALAGLAALAAAEAGQRTKLPDTQARAVNALLAYHVQYQLGHRLKTARGAIG